MRNVLIGGIGGVLLGDDGVGPYVARLLASRYEFEQGVKVADLGTPALEIIDELSGREAVILIDSVDTEATPGTVLLYRKADIMRHRPEVRMDPHSPALVDALTQRRTFRSRACRSSPCRNQGRIFRAQLQLERAREGIA